MDITAILTCHREGLLLGPSLASFREAIEEACAVGATVEALVVVDRGDALTRRIAQGSTSFGCCLVETDCGDPGQTRNAAVNRARGKYVAFLDGDDLWSYNWLEKAWHFSINETAHVICHSEANVVFGSAKQMWFHADSKAPGFRPDYLRIGNYWDAMCFAERQTLLSYPFRENNLADGFGHEDWHWNNVTLCAGIHHRPVPGTLHFKRRRKGSQMEKCDERDVVSYPTELLEFGWAAASTPVTQDGAGSKRPRKISPDLDKQSKAPDKVSLV